MSDARPTIEPTVLLKLDELAARFDELTARMNDPGTAKDPAQLVELSKEHGRLRRIVEPYGKYKKSC